MFRIGVGHAEKQPFRYACQGCSTPVEGALHVNNEELTTSLTVNNATQLSVEPKKVDYYEQAFQDLPIPPGFRSPDAPFSPFLAQNELMGPDGLIEYMQSLAVFEANRERWWDVINRAYEFRKRGDKSAFAKTVGMLDSDIQASANAFDLEKALNQARLGLFAPLIYRTGTRDRLTRLKTEVDSLVTMAAPELAALLSVISDDEIRDVQQRILELDRRFVDIYHHFRPIVATYYYIDQSPSALAPVGLSQLDFPVDKAFFIDCYETTARSLVVLVGLVNISVRGGYEQFQLGVKPAVATLAGFRGLGNGKKIQYVDAGSFWRELLSESMDPKLRNAIGHNDAHLDVPTQTIRYLEGGKPKEIPYVLFLRSAFRLYAALHDIYDLLLQLQGTAAKHLGTKK